MNPDYKYISKPYTLDELVTGNLIFKVHYDFFYELYDWEQENEFEEGNYTEKENIETLFNEFLNIISLLLIDKATYNETLKEIKLKSDQIEMFWFMAGCIPIILEEHHFLNDSNIPEKTKIYLDKISNSQISNQKIKPEETLLSVVQKYFDELDKALTEKNIFDLTYFFDIYQNDSLEQIINSVKSLQKRKNNKNISETPKELDASQKVLLIEELIRSDKWGNATDRKKAEIISQIIDRSPDNIRKILSETNKPLSSTSQKFKDDLLKSQNTIKLLG